MENNNIDDLPKSPREAKLRSQEQQGLSQEDLAARVFASQVPQFRRFVDGMSNKQLRRVLKYLVEYPLHEKDVRLPSELEKAVFSIGERLLEMKMTMKFHTLAQVEQERVRKELAEKESKVDPAKLEHLKKIEEEYRQSLNAVEEDYVTKLKSGTLENTEKKEDGKE